MQTTMINTAAAGNRIRPRLRLLVLGLSIGVVSAWSLAVQAQPASPASAPSTSHRMHHGTHDGMHHGMHDGMGGGMMLDGRFGHMGRMMDRMLDGLDATDAQRSQIRQIVQAAATDLKAQREARRGLRERGLQIFTAPTVDAAAAEALRQQVLAQHDQSSQRMTQAMLDISRVLTPEQRAKLGERIKDRAARLHDRQQREQPRK